MSLNEQIHGWFNAWVIKGGVEQLLAELSKASFGALDVVVVVGDIVDSLPLTSVISKDKGAKRRNTIAKS